VSDNYPGENRMTTIDLAIHKDRRARVTQRARERKIVIPK